LQSESKQPFYIKANGQIFSSSEEGYVIIPKIPSGKFDFVLGFPKNVWPSIPYSVEIKSLNVGYTLKHFGGGNWKLVNLQSKEVQEMPVANNIPTADTSVDEFTALLAQVGNVSLSRVFDSIKSYENKKDSISVTTQTKNDTTTIAASRDSIISNDVIAEKKDSTNQINIADQEKKTDTVVVQKNLDTINVLISTVADSASTYTTLADTTKKDAILDATKIGKVSTNSEVVINDRKVDTLKNTIAADSIISPIAIAADSIKKNMDTLQQVIKNDSDSSLKIYSQDTLISKVEMLDSSKFQNNIFKDSSIVESNLIINKITDSVSSSPSPIEAKSIKDTSMFVRKDFLNKDSMLISKDTAISIKDSTEVKEIISELPIVVDTNSKANQQELNANQQAVKLSEIKIDTTVDKNNIKLEYSYLDSSGRTLIYQVEELKKPDTVALKISYTDSVAKLKVAVQETKSIAIDTTFHCVLAAGDSDIITLRRKMIAAENEVAMFEVSMVYLPLKCYTTLQLKNLAVLFLDEKKRLEFLKNGYAYCMDPSSFNTLQILFVEDQMKAEFNKLFY
jgi:hypothetical protein